MLLGRGNATVILILAVFKSQFPAQPGAVLELASGSGMHLHYFAPHFPISTFNPPI